VDLHGAGRKLKENDMETATLYHRDGHAKIFTVAEISRMASCGQIGAGRDWSSVKPPPPGWERETPKYRATRDLRPAERARYRLESPFGAVFNSEIWQYATREIKAGEIIETKEWPHPTFMPLNYGAERVLEFFNTRMKSRMTTSPWHGDGLRLDDGMSGKIIVSAATPQLQPMNLRPVA
jgi:hypothetical protein